jgi:small subunit ribosomal protein S16
VSVRIRLTRTGRKNLPSYRIAAFDSRTRRDGPPVEVLGWFNPLSREAGKGFKVQTDRVEAWIARGARLTLAVTQLLGRQGVTLATPAKAPAPAKAAKPAKKAAAPGRRTPKPDPAAIARHKRKLARRASRRAHLAKKAAAAVAAAAKKE